MTHPAIIPVLRYGDAPTAIDFLCRAFGFVERARHLDSADPTKVVHAELMRNGQVVMLSSVMPTSFSLAAPMVTVAEAGGVTQSIYVVVDDVATHEQRARAEGARIIMPLTTEDYGGTSYSVRDCEGHVWTFGSYDPFEAAPR